MTKDNDSRVRVDQGDTRSVKERDPAEVLFSPFSIGRLHLKNRIVHAPMHSNFPNADGSVSERLLAYVDSQSKGGAGLVYVEHASVEAPRGNNSPITLNISHDRFAIGLAELAEVVHFNGAKVAIQIDHGGRQSSLRATRGEELISCSSVPWIPSGTVPRPMTATEIKQTVVLFAEAAVRAQLAGFDAVTIHAGHGYLVSSFLSPFANTRQDEYGGSLDNRMRFLLEIVTACREKVGPCYPLIVRLNGADHTPGGLTNEDVVTIARCLEKAGVDAIDMTSGTRESAQWQFPTLYMDAGLQLADVSAVRKAVKIPLIAIGKINTPDLAASVVADGVADLVSFGRELLADPEMPRKIREGRGVGIRPCIYCNDCMMQLRVFRGVACTVNPRLGRERRFPGRTAARSRKVVVVGGGPAGLTAAWWARRCGHLVTLYEASSALGGRLAASAKLPFRLEQRRWLDLLIRENDAIGVNTLLNMGFNENEARKLDADVLIVAWGMEYEAPEGMLQISDLVGLLERVGEVVVITDVSQEGCEGAAMLATTGRSVTLVGPHFAPGVETAVRNSLLEKLAASSVTLMEGCSIESVTDRKLHLEKPTGERVEITFDTVIAPPTLKSKTLPEEVVSLFDVTEVIGDAAGTRGFMDAVAAGAAAALRI